MSRSVSAPSSVTKTSPCWNGFIVPGSTLRYGSSFCIVTRRPRAVSNWPRLEAVSPLPSEEATPPVTKTCLVMRACDKSGSRGDWSERRPPAGPTCLSTGFHSSSSPGGRCRSRGLRVARGAVTADLAGGRVAHREHGDDLAGGVVHVVHGGQHRPIGAHHRQRAEVVGRAGAAGQHRAAAGPLHLSGEAGDDRGPVG